MKIKFVCAAAAVAFACSSQVAFAEDAPTPEITVTGSAAVVSQYRFRGISQSDNKPAVQAAITVADKSGFYVSFWGSSASAGQSQVNIGGTEIDVYGGYTHAIGKTGITFDGGLYGYLYPGAPAGNYFELYGSLSKAYGPFTVKGGLNWAPDQGYFDAYQGISHYNMYEYGEISFSPAKLPALTIHTHLGHTGGGFNYTKEYLDYTVGASYKWKNLTLDASVVGTNVSSDNASNAGFIGSGPGSAYEIYRAAKTAGVVSLTASF
ncbi:MAG TPA: TorF family putative porin [Novosphingobium sp.]|nr:TorF family putative porin [Novosphingobium sp.]